MNCKQFEKLIPLYVENDLEGDELRDVAEHLHGCHSCARLTNRSKASQEWLHSLSTPEFDEAFYVDLKRSVMQEIHRQKARPSFFQWFTGRWNPVYALAFLLLMLFGALAVYWQSNKLVVNQNSKTASTEETEPQPEPPSEPQRNKEEINTPVSLPNQATTAKPHSVRRQHREKPSTMRLSPATLEPIVEAQISLNNRDAINAEEMSEWGTYISSQEMTRIEFQTADPNIRIIWFAPKTVELPKTMTE